ncbi:hypothetical protein TNCV_4869031 [Trichonephila clavipes]|nr:hypothetical protein TNCV_4869031 [Trichonephila clavipes]
MFEASLDFLETVDVTSLRMNLGVSVRISSYNRLDAFSRWKAVGRIETNPSQVEVVKWKVTNVPSCGINSGTVIRKVSQRSHRATTPAQDFYLALSARRHRRTAAPLLTRDIAAVSKRKISRQTVNKHLAGTGFYTQRPIVCVSLTGSNRKDQLLWSRKHPCVDTQRMGTCSFH